MNMEYTQVCPICKKEVTMEVDEQKFHEYEGGENIQNVFGDKDKFFREWLISGMCYDCSSKLFNAPKPGEDWGPIVGECENCGAPLYNKDNGVCPSCGYNPEMEEL